MQGNSTGIKFLMQFLLGGGNPIKHFDTEQWINSLGTVVMINHQIASDLNSPGQKWPTRVILIEPLSDSDCGLLSQILSIMKITNPRQYKGI